MKHIKDFNHLSNENLDHSEKENRRYIPKITVKDIIEYFEKNFDDNTEVIISSFYAKGNTPEEFIKTSGLVHDRNDGIIVLQGLQ
jgi:hypothetical protein